MKTTSHSSAIFSMAGKATFLLAAVLPLLPLPMQAECKQWDISGEWQLKQSNGIPISMDLRQNGTAVTGTAFYSSTTHRGKVLGLIKQGQDTTIYRGPVVGIIEGSYFNVRITWQDGRSGVYRGKVQVEGRFEGNSYDAGAPSKRFTWFSDRAMKCAGDLR